MKGSHSVSTKKVPKTGEDNNEPASDNDVSDFAVNIMAIVYFSL